MHSNSGNSTTPGTTETKVTVVEFYSYCKWICL